MKWLKKAGIPLLLIAALYGCATSLQIANRFVVEETDIHVLVLPPTDLIKSFATEHPDSIPTDSITGPDDERAQFVNQVRDSVFISEFMNSLNDHLDRLYIQSYGPDEADEFFSLEQPAYIFFIAQMELFEYVEVEYFEGRSGFNRYVGSVEITVLENNIWFEFMKLHDPDFQMQVLFNTHATSDYVEGSFLRLSTGQVVFNPTRYLMTEDDLYDLAYFSGKQNAHKIFDHLLNLYVRKEYGRDYPNYFHYDMQKHSILERDYPPFIRINDTDAEE